MQGSEYYLPSKPGICRAQQRFAAQAWGDGYWQLLLRGETETTMKSQLKKGPKALKSQGCCSAPQCAPWGVQANDSTLGNTGLPPLSDNSLNSASATKKRCSKPGFLGPWTTRSCQAPKLICHPQQTSAPDTAPQHITCWEPSLGSGPQGSARVQFSEVTCWRSQQKDDIQKGLRPRTVIHSLHKLLKLELEESLMWASANPSSQLGYNYIILLDNVT